MSILNSVGVRFRDMDPALTDALVEPACSPGHQLDGLAVAYSVSIDLGRLDEARQRLDRLWGLVSDTPSAPDVALDRAYFAAVQEGNAVEARRWFDEAGEEGTPMVRDLAEAATLIAEGDPAAARAVLDRAGTYMPYVAQIGTGTIQQVVEQYRDLVARAGENRHG